MSAFMQDPEVSSGVVVVEMCVSNKGKPSTQVCRGARELRGNPKGPK